MAKWREDPCVKLPVPAWEIGSMHEKIDCRLREKGRGEELPQHRGSSSIDAKLELEIVAQEAKRGFEGSTEGRAQRERETRSESKLESIERMPGIDDFRDRWNFRPSNWLRLDGWHPFGPVFKVEEIGADRRRAISFGVTTESSSSPHAPIWFYMPSLPDACIYSITSLA